MVGSGASGAVRDGTLDAVGEIVCEAGRTSCTDIVCEARSTGRGTVLALEVETIRVHSMVARDTAHCTFSRHRVSVVVDATDATR